MRLWHGTSEAAARSIIRDGLKPRGLLAKSASNWEVESRADLTYLSSAYAPYFAIVAADGCGRMALIEVEVEPESLLPDEDFLEQTSRSYAVPGCTALDTPGRTAWFRDHLEGFRHHASDSLARLGNAAHYGVPPEDIQRVVLFDPRRCQQLAWMALDPQISLWNHRLMGDKYRGLTRALVGEDVTVDEILGKLSALGLPESGRAQIQASLDALPEALEVLEIPTK